MFKKKDEWCLGHLYQPGKGRAGRHQKECMLLPLALRLCGAVSEPCPLSSPPPPQRVCPSTLQSFSTFTLPLKNQSLHSREPALPPAESPCEHRPKAASHPLPVVPWGLVATGCMGFALRPFLLSHHPLTLPSLSPTWLAGRTWAPCHPGSSLVPDKEQRSQ